MVVDYSRSPSKMANQAKSLEKIAQESRSKRATFIKRFLPLSLTLTADERHVTILGHKTTCLDSMLSKIEPGKPGSRIPITPATHSGQP